MKSTFAIVVAALTLITATAQSEEEGAFTVQRLTDTLYQLSTDQGEYTTNSLVSVGADGVLIVDTQAREVADQLAAVVAGFGKGAPKIIVNTHRHVEHVGGNAVFGADPIVIAHDLVPAKLRSGAYLFEEFPDATFPDITFSGEMNLFFNGERIHLIAMAGSHDDNEIIVHFTGSKVVHLSSLVNGFNFPSVDADGSVLAFPDLVERALTILPDDVVIVSGHNRNGTVEDLRAYHRMLVETITSVRDGLGAGKTEEQLQEEGVLDPWSSYAGSYVSTDEWISYIVDAFEHAGEAAKPSVFETMYHTLKEHGVDHAIARYAHIKESQADDFEVGELDLLVIGLKLGARGDHQRAARFLAASLEHYPDSEYTYYTLFQLALAEQALGDTAGARDHARRALALKPDNRAIATLVEDLDRERRAGS